VYALFSSKLVIKATSNAPRMSTQQNDQDPHWNYFLALDRDFLRLSRYIEFSVDNESTYSIELARLLMTAAAEVDVVARSLSQDIDPTSRASDINAYQPLVVGRYPRLLDCTVLLPRFGMALTPWKDWLPGSPPAWWTSNNKVKHRRAEHFREASLKNAVSATAGLLVLLLVSYEKRPFVAPAPVFFDPNGSFGYLDRGGVQVIRIT
jgi:hypothetical protein